jgi:hypothetical protein
MAVDGNWNLVLCTPMGDRNSHLSLKSAGSVLTGTQGDESNSAEIFDGIVSGNDVAWKLTVTTPLTFTLEFKGTVAGDAMTGQLGLGPMGNFSFTGKRA